MRKIHWKDIFEKVETYSQKQYINFSDPVKLRLEKNDYGDYNLSFFNPCVGEWWILPSTSAGIHRIWGFYQKGSYGAYGLGKFEISRYDVQSFQSHPSFKNLRDIQVYFERCQKIYFDFEKSQELKNSLPNVINL